MLRENKEAFKAAFPQHLENQKLTCSSKHTHATWQHPEGSRRLLISIVTSTVTRCGFRFMSLSLTQLPKRRVSWLYSSEAAGYKDSQTYKVKFVLTLETCDLLTVTLPKINIMWKPWCLQTAELHTIACSSIPAHLQTLRVHRMAYRYQCRHHRPSSSSSS